MTLSELVNMHTEVHRLGALSMYTITENPKDYPGKFVVRVHFVAFGEGSTPGPIVTIEDTLAEARTALEPLGLFCSPRADGDDPVIVETWF